MGWGRWTIIGCGLLLLCLLLACSSGYAEAPTESAEPPFSSSLRPLISAAARPVRLESPRPHLLDFTLYGAIGGYRAFDYLSTKSALAGGAREAVLPQWVVNDDKAFVAFEGLATSVEVGSSIWLIRRGHRRMARAMNLVSIGLGTKTVLHNYSEP